MGKYWSSIGGIRVRNEDKPPPPPPQPRLCKTCGVVVGKGKSFCVDCKKERLVKKRKRVGREYREKYKEYYRQYMKEYDEKRYRQRYCKECDIEVGKRKHYCDECRVKKNKEYNKTYWRNNPYSEWSDEKKKKHSETTKRYFLKNKDKLTAIFI